jgi:hypothetical protein
MILYFDLEELGYYSLKTKLLIKIYDYDLSFILDKNVKTNSEGYFNYRIKNVYNPYYSLITLINTIQNVDFPKNLSKEIYSYFGDMMEILDDRMNIYYKDFIKIEAIQSFNNPEFIYKSVFYYTNRHKIQPLFSDFINHCKDKNIYRKIDEFPENEIVFHYPKEKHLRILEYSPSLNIPILETKFNFSYKTINKYSDKYMNYLLNSPNEDNFLKRINKLDRYGNEKDLNILKKEFIERYKDYNKLSESSKKYIDIGLKVLINTNFYNIPDIFINNSKDNNLLYLLTFIRNVLGNNRLPITLKKMILI